MPSVDYSSILTSTVVAAIVSASVSFMTSWLTYRHARLKIRYEAMRPRLERVLDQLAQSDKIIFGGALGQLQRKSERVSLGPADVMEFINGPFRQTVDGFVRIREVYDKEKYLLTKEDVDSIDQKLRSFDEGNLAFRRLAEGGATDDNTLALLFSLYPLAIEIFSDLKKAFHSKIEEIDRSL